MSIFSTSLLPSQRAMLRTLRKNGASSRLELGNRCRLSSGAVTRFGRELIDLGFVLEEMPKSSSGAGRPTQRLALRGAVGAILGFAVHPGWIEAVSMDFQGTTLIADRFPNDEPLSLTSAIQAMKDFIQTHRTQSGQPILGIGLAVPGYVTQGQQKRQTVQGLEEWREIDLAQFFGPQLAFDVFVDNDASCNALAEYYAPETRGAEIVLAVTMGAGVGGGVAMHGRLLRGAHGNAGEIGWLFPYGVPRPSARDFFESVSAEFGPTAKLADLVLEDSQISQNMDAWCQRAADQLRLVIGPGGGWIDPDHIVLCGPLPPTILTRTANYLSTVRLFEPETNIVRPIPKGSSLGAQGTAIGAALLPFQALCAADTNIGQESIL